MICNSNSDSKVIMISDTMITSPHLSIEFEHRTPKIMALSDNCVACAAGNALLHSELFDKARMEVGQLKSPSILQIVGCVKKCYRAMREQGILETVLSPRGIPSFDKFYEIQKEMASDISLNVQGEIDNYQLGGEVGFTILIGGVDAKGAHIYKIDHPGNAECYDSIGYEGIGSGEFHALTSLIGRDYHITFPLNDALLAAYEAKKIAEKSPGVGSRTDISIVDGRRVITFSDADIKELDRVYTEKKKFEMDTAQNKNWAKELDGLVQLLGKKRGDKHA
jgi:20S proteasome alpha/beta subunit